MLDTMSAGQCVGDLRLQQIHGVLEMSNFPVKEEQGSLDSR